jgi:hypothetical protein
VTDIAGRQSIARVFYDVQSRLNESTFSTLAYIFIPFFLVTILALFVGFETSDRFKSPIEAFQYAATPSSDHKIWMSVGLIDELIVIKTSSGKTFKWSAAGPSESDYDSFENHLKGWAKSHLQNTILAGQLLPSTNTAAIAVDQRLTAHHIRPVIYALAAAGVSRYGFETKLPE